MLSIRNLNFSWGGGDFNLHIPQLQIAAGSMTVITGPSGCGKTTLLNLLAGILLPTRGQIVVGNEDVGQMTDSQRRRFRLQHVGMVFQDFQLIEYLSVFENVFLPCRLSPSVVAGKSLRASADDLLTRVGLAPHRNRSVTRLSQGEKQRVAICRALLLKPQLILADEPTGNLDPRTSNHVLTLLLSAARAANATLVMVTHDHALLSRFDQHIEFEQFLQWNTDGIAAMAPLHDAGDAI